MLNKNSFLIPMLLLASLLSMTGCGDQSVPSTPDGTVTTVARELANNNPRVLWDSMPASYQSDVELLIQDAASKMDSEIYDEAFVIAQKVVDVLKNKRDFILGHPMLEQGFVAMLIKDQEELQKNWMDVVELVDIYVSSELNTLDSLNSLDVGDFLDGTGRKFMAQLEKLSKLSADPSLATTWEKLSTANVVVKSTEDDKAILEIQVNGEEPDTVTMINYEGKWIPEEVARDWDKNLEQMKIEIAEMTTAMKPEQKTTALAKIAAMESVLDQLAKAETQEEFTGITMSLMAEILR